MQREIQSKVVRPSRHYLEFLTFRAARAFGTGSRYPFGIDKGPAAFASVAEPITLRQAISRARRKGDYRGMKGAKAPSRQPRQRLVTRLPSSVRPYLRSLRFAVNKAGAAVVRPAIKYVPGTSRDFGPPRGFARSLKQYAERHSGSASYTELYPEHRVIRTLPIVAHPSVPSGQSSCRSRSERIPPRAWG